MKYRDMTPEQKESKKANAKKRRSEHREEYNERKRKYYSKHREERNGYMRKYRAENSEEHKRYMSEYRTKYREELNEYMRKYSAKSTNSAGVTKRWIRVQSGRILDETHAKLSGYEIHHCFGYDDPNRFIYIPRTLHLQIHQLLRDNKIPADSDHWKVIRDLVNSCEEYTYIRC